MPILSNFTRALNQPIRTFYAVYARGCQVLFAVNISNPLYPRGVQMTRDHELIYDKYLMRPVI